MTGFLVHSCTYSHFLLPRALSLNHSLFLQLFKTSCIRLQEISCIASMAPALSSLLLTFTILAAASVVAEPKPDGLAPEYPHITPSPTLQGGVTRTVKHRRGILDDIKGNVNSVLSDLGSNVPSYVASGVPNFFQGFPDGDGVRQSLGLDDSQISALPTSVLNIP